MEELVKANTLIAKFMGYEIIPYNGNKNTPIYNGNKYAKTVGEAKSLWNGLDLQFTGRFTKKVKYPFDTDFSYLIPVIRRIEEHGYVVAIKGISYQVYKILDEHKFASINDAMAYFKTNYPNRADLGYISKKLK